MAGTDVTVQYYFNRVVIPAVVLGVLFRASRGHLRVLYNKFYARALNRFGQDYNKFAGKRKQRLFADMHDLALARKTDDEGLKILEIGAGSGANFRYFPEHSEVQALEPNPEFGDYLDEHSDSFPHIHYMGQVVGKAEDMPAVDSESMDVVVCTLVLCTCVDVEGALMEVIRVLKPGGRFYYMEHVCADKRSWTYQFQKWLDPIWFYVGDGCQFTKETWKYIEAAGFSKVEHERYDQKLTRPAFVVRPHLAGVATK